MAYEANFTTADFGMVSNLNDTSNISVPIMVTALTPLVAETSFTCTLGINGSSNTVELKWDTTVRNSSVSD